MVGLANAEQLTILLLQAVVAHSGEAKECRAIVVGE